MARPALQRFRMGSLNQRRRDERWVSSRRFEPVTDVDVVRGSWGSAAEIVYWACGQPYCSRSQVSTSEMR
jgi:hypothetical protein